jgi:hypothetical protein
MPRIYSSTSDPIDFCKKCFPAEDNAIKRYGNVGEGPDGRGNCYGYDAEHPDYDGDDSYTCRRCRKRLNGEVDA